MAPATMVVGSLIVYLRLEGCRSLKDKRHIVRGLLDKARTQLRVAAAETDLQDLWGNAVLGFAYVSGDAVLVETVLQKVVSLIDASAEVEIEETMSKIERDPWSSGS